MRDKEARGEQQASRVRTAGWLRVSGWFSMRPLPEPARGGKLTINWAGEGQPVYMSGPAETVFEGEIEI